DWSSDVCSSDRGKFHLRCINRGQLQCNTSAHIEGSKVIQYRSRSFRSTQRLHFLVQGVNRAESVIDGLLQLFAFSFEGSESTLCSHAADDILELELSFARI